MQIESSEITRVLNKVRVAREHLHEAWPPKSAQVLSVMDFHWAIEDIYELKIEMKKVSFLANHLRGKVLRFGDNRARIYVRADQTPEFLRFVAVKELCHLMIDEEDDWSSSGVDTIKGMLREWELVGQNGTGHTSPSIPIQSELLAEIAAVEMTYPREFRDNDINRIRAGETTVEKVALDHDLPPYAIEQAHGHHKILEEHWTMIEAELAQKG